MTAQKVADYFLAAAPDDDFITNMKLQKLVYYAQGFALAIAGAPLFKEPIEAWMHGPVVPELYHTYKQYGANAIPAPEIDFEEYAPHVTELLDEIYEVYGQFTANALRGLTHREPPWQDTKSGEVITHEKMLDYFSTQIN